MTARKLKTLGIRPGDVIQIGEDVEIRVVRDRQGIAKIEIHATSDLSVVVAKCRPFPLNCGSKNK